MPQVTINYKKPETLKILKGLAKYLDFDVLKEKNNTNRASVPLDDNSISDHALAEGNINKEEQERRLKGILIPGNKKLDINALRKIFTGKNIDAKELRKSAWGRNK